MRKIGILITLGQVVALLFAILAIVLVFRFPPYETDASLIGGDAYFVSGMPPTESAGMWSLNNSLLRWELVFIGLTLCAALIAFGRGAGKSQRHCMLIGLALEAAFLGGSLPSINNFMGPEFTWFVLNMLAVAVLFLVFIAEIDRCLGSARGPSRS